MLKLRCPYTGTIRRMKSPRDDCSFRSRIPVLTGRVFNEYSNLEIGYQRLHPVCSGTQVSNVQLAQSPGESYTGAQLTLPYPSRSPSTFCCSSLSFHPLLPAYLSGMYLCGGAVGAPRALAFRTVICLNRYPREATLTLLMCWGPVSHRTFAERENI